MDKFYTERSSTIEEAMNTNKNEMKSCQASLFASIGSVALQILTYLIQSINLNEDSNVNLIYTYMSTSL
jgi:hypothetical protein